MKKLLFWSIMVISLVACSGNYKTITYSTTDGEIINVEPTAFDAKIVSHTYKFGKGKIVFDKAVTRIREGAFYDCSSLTSITIPDSVTSIGYFAFYRTGIYYNPANWKNGALYINNCLIDVQQDLIGDYTIKAGTRIIADRAFEGCSSLTSVTIPNSVTSIGDDAFYNCSSLRSVTIPNSVTSIGEDAFSDCSSLTSPVCNAHCFAYMPISYSGAYAIPEGIKQIADGACKTCNSLTSVTIPNSVTSIGGYAFFGCSSLTSINIPDSVKMIREGAFCHCSSLTSITIPNSVTSIGRSAFSGCRGLTAITIPNSVTEIGEYAFAWCESLTHVKYIGTKEQWKNIEKSSDWTYCSKFRVVHCTDGEIRPY